MSDIDKPITLTAADLERAWNYLAQTDTVEISVELIEKLRLTERANP